MADSAMGADNRAAPGAVKDAISSQPHPRVLLLGWDAAEWSIIRPLLAAGRMPHLQRLVTAGPSGVLHAPQPLLSPTLWTSLITGSHATKHRVLAALTAKPDMSGPAPVGAAACRLPPLWTLLHRAGLVCHSINFPATHPAQPTGGVSVSNYFIAQPGAAGAISPPDCRDVLAELRVEPADIDGPTLRFFLSDPAAATPTDSRLELIATIISHAATVHAVATWALEHRPWDFAAICYTGLHQFSHSFMPYAAPRRAPMPEADFAAFQSVVDRAYMFHDQMLGRLLELSGPNTYVFLVSDHGFVSGNQRPPRHGDDEDAMLAWHRPEGMFVATGPGLARQAVVNVRTVDIAPSILRIFGLPPAPGMGGTAISALPQSAPRAGGAKPARTPAQTLKPTPAQGADLPPGEDLAAPAADRAVDYLLKLGYRDQPDAYAAAAITALADQENYHLAQAWLDAQQPEEAIALLEDLTSRHATNLNYSAALGRAYAAARRFADAQRLVAGFLGKFPDSPLALAAAGMLAAAVGQRAVALQFLQRAEAVAHPASADNAPPQPPQLPPEWLIDMGNAYLQIQRFDLAAAAFQRAVNMDEYLTEGHLGLAAALLRQDRREDAVAAAGRAAALGSGQADTHCRLAWIFWQLGVQVQALEQFHEALRLAPGSIHALRGLAHCHRRRGEIDQADAFARRAIVAAAQRNSPTFPTPGGVALRRR